MNIAVIGAGAIGSVIAGYLAKAGREVMLVGRKEHVFAIEKNGLKISGIKGEETIRLKALTKLDQEYDLVIFATKTQDLEQAYDQNQEYLENGLMMTTQNGVQADNILSCHFEKENMFSSIVMFGATYVNPGEVIYNFAGDWIIGKPFTPIGPKVHELAAILGKSELNMVVSTNITGMKWLKLFVNFNNCIAALTGKSMQETFADMDMCRLSILLLREGVDIVKKAKMELVSMPQFSVDRLYGLTTMPVEQAAQIIHKTLTGLSKEPLYGSILQSIMRGKSSEIDFINGEVVQLAFAMRQQAPLNDQMISMVHEVENTGRFFDFEEIKKDFDL